MDMFICWLQESNKSLITDKQKEGQTDRHKLKIEVKISLCLTKWNVWRIEGKSIKRQIKFNSYFLEMKRNFEIALINLGSAFLVPYLLNYYKKFQI